MNDDDGRAERPLADDAARQAARGGCCPNCGNGAGPSTVGSSADGPPPSASIPPSDSARQSLTARSAHPAERDKEEVVITPNTHRLVQVRRTGKRKLFDKKRKEVFLEWFAATCNARLSAGKADISEKTVWKHVRDQPAFEAAFIRALEIGYLRLEARRLQEAQTIGVATAPDDGSSDAPGEEAYEIRCDLDEELIEEHFDPALAAQLLRDHGRRLGLSPQRKPNAGGRVASGQEVVDALTKRLAAFGVRALREAPPAPPNAADPGGQTNEAGPPPARG